MKNSVVNDISANLYPPAGMLAPVVVLLEWADVSTINLY